MVTDSIVSFIVRPGNPKHITTWADLIKPGVGVITPNVFSSGSAKWNLMAAYGAQISLGKSPAQAQAYLPSCSRTRWPSPPAPAPRCRRSSRARATSCSTTRTTGSTPRARVRPSASSRRRRRSSSRTRSPSPRRPAPPPRRSWPTSSPPPARPCGASRATAPCSRRWRPSSSFPKPKTLFSINKFGGWTTVNTKFFDPDHGHRGEDRAVTRRLHRQLVVVRDHCGRYRRRPGSARGGRRAG